MFETSPRRPDRLRVNRRLELMAERVTHGRPLDPDEPHPDDGAFRPPDWFPGGPRDPPADGGDPDGDPDREPDREPDGRARGSPPLPRLLERWAPGGGGGLARVLAAVRRRPVWLLGGVGVLVAVITASSMLSGAPKPEATPRLPPALSSTTASAAPGSAAAPVKIIVSVVGKVAEPGLVTLPDGARVADALHAAGGVAAGARITALNLARRLADGEQIYVGIPVPPGASPVAPVPGTADAGSAAGTSGAPGGKLDLNTATAEQLDELPGIGEVTAQNILDWRTEHGRFSSVGQLNDVDGIGEVRYGRLKDVVEVR